MNCKNFVIEYMSPDALILELRFDVACARSLGFELIRLELSPSDPTVRGRFLTTVTRKLATMRRDGTIQFFATQKSFAEQETEAVYLLNKCPRLADDPSLADGAEERTVFVRI